MHPAQKALLTGSATIRPRTADNDRGEPTWGSPVTYPARPVSKVRAIPRQDGTTVISEGYVILAEDAVVSVRDEITVNGRVAEVLAVGAPPEALSSAVDHLEVSY